MTHSTTSRIPSIFELALYAATLLLEVPVILARMLLVCGVGALLLLVTGHPLEGLIESAEGLAKLALIPTAWSLLALVIPIGGGWWWKQGVGGRDPSGREREAFEDAMGLLRENAQAPIYEPATWFVLDEVLPDAAVCGDVLMLTRGMLESEHLPAVLAHELGHLASSDGRLTAALNRLTIKPPPRVKQEQGELQEHRSVLIANDRLLLSITLVGIVVWSVRRLVVFAGGGFGLRLLAPFWGSYWREREYLADSYAVCLGQGEELADFLELHAIIRDHSVPFVWMTDHSHPSSELRIDRLRKAGARHQRRVIEDREGGQNPRSRDITVSDEAEAGRFGQE